MATGTSEAKTQQNANLSRPALRVCKTPGSTMGATSSEHANMVLVVHSDRIMRYRLTVCLERLGYDVIAVSTSERAVWALQHEPGRIRAVFASQQLQYGAGSDLLRFVARHHPDVKRVLMPEAGSNYPANDVDPEIDHVVFDSRSDMTSVLAAMFAVL